MWNWTICTGQAGQRLLVWPVINGHIQRGQVSDAVTGRLWASTGDSARLAWNLDMVISVVISQDRLRPSGLPRAHNEGKYFRHSTGISGSGIVSKVTCVRIGPCEGGLFAFVADRRHKQKGPVALSRPASRGIRS